MRESGRRLGWSYRVTKSDDMLMFVCSITIVVIITWPEKFDFLLMPEHDVTGILT